MIITFVFKNYFPILLSVSISMLIVFISGLYLIFKKSKIKQKPQSVEDENLAAIAGDDLIATQLDLACAYIQVNKNLLAKKILESILIQGNVEQRQEAQRLLETI